MSEESRQVEEARARPGEVPFVDLASMRRENLNTSPITVTNTVSRVFEYGHRRDENSTTIQIRGRVETNMVVNNNNSNNIRSLLNDEERAYFDSVMRETEEFFRREDREAAAHRIQTNPPEVIELSDTEYETELELKIANRPKRLNRCRPRFVNEFGIREPALPPPVRQRRNRNLIQDESINSTDTREAIPPVNTYANLFADLDIVRPSSIQATSTEPSYVAIPSPSLNTQSPSVINLPTPAFGLQNIFADVDIVRPSSIQPTSTEPSYVAIPSPSLNTQSPSVITPATPALGLQNIFADVDIVRPSSIQPTSTEPSYVAIPSPSLNTQSPSVLTPATPARNLLNIFADLPPQPVPPPDINAWMELNQKSNKLGIPTAQLNETFTKPIKITQDNQRSIETSLVTPNSYTVTKTIIQPNSLIPNMSSKPATITGKPRSKSTETIVRPQSKTTSVPLRSTSASLTNRLNPQKFCKPSESFARIRSSSEVRKKPSTVTSGQYVDPSIPTTSNNEASGSRTPIKTVPQIIIQPPTPNSQPLSPNDLFDGKLPNQNIPIKISEKSKELLQIVKRSKPVKLPTSVKKIPENSSEITKTNEKNKLNDQSFIRDPRIRKIFENNERNISKNTKTSTDKPLWGISLKNQKSDPTVSKSNEMRVVNVCSSRRLLDSTSEEEQIPDVPEDTCVESEVFSAEVTTEEIVKEQNPSEVATAVIERIVKGFFGIKTDTNFEEKKKKVDTEKTEEISEKNNTEEKKKLEKKKKSVEKLSLTDKRNKSPAEKLHKITAEKMYNSETISPGDEKLKKYTEKLTKILEKSEKAQKNKNSEDIATDKSITISKPKIGPKCFKDKIQDTSKISKPKIGPKCFKDKIQETSKITKPKIGPKCFKDKTQAQQCEISPPKIKKPKVKIGPKCFKTAINKPKIGPLCYKQKIMKIKPKIGPASYKYKNLKKDHDIYITKTKEYILPKCSVPLLKLNENNVNSYTKEGKYSSALATTLKDYFQSNDIEKDKLMCLICGNSYKRIVEHYVRKHPKSDVFISRMNPASVKQAITEVKIPTPVNPTLCCRFCNFTTENSLHFYCHCTSHTGEYNYQCEFCGFLAPNRSNVLTHITLAHKVKAQIANVVQLSKFNNSMNRFPAYVCKFCNYLQMDQKKTLIHLDKDHKSKDIYDIIEINLASYIPDKKALQDQLPHCSLRKKVSGGSAVPSKAMTGKAQTSTQNSGSTKPTQTATAAGKSTEKSASRKMNSSVKSDVQRKRSYTSSSDEERPVKRRVRKRRSQDFQCSFCTEWYSMSNEEWLCCLGCNQWIHDGCTDYQDHCNSCAKTFPWCNRAALKDETSSSASTDFTI